ncbi:MAG TPA: molybdopterin-dependent oxidoreductase [Steroidobacteraceae bacterium]|jgi:formate dehydrogenase
MAPSKVLRTGESGDHITYCRLCEATCGLIAHVENRIVTHIGPDRASPHSHGMICAKGPAMRFITHDPDRILHPLRRNGAPGQFERVSWEEALADISSALDSILKENGPDAFAGYFGNPLAFATFSMTHFMSFLNACGSHKLYSPGSQDTATRSVASDIVFGGPFMFPMPDLARTDLIFVFGANPLVSRGSLFMTATIREDLDAIAARGRVVIFDPRRTESAKVYEHVFVRSDADVWLLAVIIRTIIESGRIDRAFIESHTVGFGEFSAALRELDCHYAAERCAVPLDKIRDLANSFANAERAVAYGRVGVCRGTFSTLTNVLIDALNIITGRFGRPGGWGFGLRLRKDGSHFGGASVGTRRTRVGGLPDVGGHLPGALLAADIAAPGPGQVRALMVAAGNPVLSVPDGRKLEEALSKLELMFCLDFYMTETSKYANYILPVTTFLERADSTLEFTQAMVRPCLQATPPVIAPIGEARPEHEIFPDLARRLGVPHPLPSALPSEAIALGIEPSHEASIDMTIRLSDFGDHYGARPEGISLEKLIQGHPSGFPLGTSDLLADSLSQLGHSDGRIHLWDKRVESEFRRLENSASLPEPTFRLIGRRNLLSMNSWMHNAERLVRSQRPRLQMNDQDGYRLNLSDGALVSIQSKTGRVEAEVKLTADLMPGVVCYPHGWGHDGGWTRANLSEGVNFNLLASSDPSDLEQLSGMSFLDGIPVAIEPIRVQESADESETPRRSADVAYDN